MADANGTLDSDVENLSSVLNHSTYSLADASFSRNESFQLNLRRNGDCDGFDASTGENWIYPVDVPVRQYQHTIAEAALLKNTLVVLPTGLGKTFIAAVVMYNVYRWYPTGKVIFMAPTRPLVSQQIDACHRVVGIPRADTAEVTGKQPRTKRATLWQTRRVFYATPQVVLSDLRDGTGGRPILPAKQVRLVVIDEAHKAKGRYAYADVIRLLADVNPCFRVLALSATPGRTLEDVAEVVKNLLISHIEVRYDNSPDLQPYIHRREVRTIVIPLGRTIGRIREELVRLVDPYLQRLLEANAFGRYPQRFTHGMLVMELKRYRNDALHQRHPAHSTIVSDFYACIGMYHAMELLVRHGIRALLNYLLGGGGSGGGGGGDSNAQEKYFIAKDRQIKLFLERMKEQYPQHLPPGQSAGALDGPDASTGDDEIDFGHPKYRILERQLREFFHLHPDSRAIVFCEFRDSVATIERLLSDSRPEIRARCIVGQGSANGVRVPQQEQIDVIRQFRAGTINTVIATCVAEEGIDVGEVDLIVCFDIAKNPTRFVQRVGRTGRQRVGRVLMLVTEGDEHETLKQVLASKDKTNRQLARSKDILNVLYRSTPRLVPVGVVPKCMKVNMAPQSVRGQQNGSDSSDGDESPVGRKRRRSKGPQDTPVGTRCKSSPLDRSIRRFFQPRGHDASGELDASERDIFSVPSPNRTAPNDSSRGDTGNTSRTAVQQTINAQVRRLVQHYKQLSRQKFACGQLLPAMLQKRKNPLPSVPGKRDNPLDLPELMPLDRVRPEESLTLGEGGDKSISNLFDTSWVSDGGVACPEPAAEAKRKELPPNSAAKQKSLTVSTAKKAKKGITAPLDMCNSPLLLAFNRSVQKRKNSDRLETPLKTATNEQCDTAKSLDESDEKRRMALKMTLEYFKLSNILDIFDDSSDEPDMTGVKGWSINRRLFGEQKVSNRPSTVPERTVADEEWAAGWEQANAADRTLQPVEEPKTPKQRRLPNKCFDLGSPDLVFQDDSDTDCSLFSSVGSAVDLPAALANIREAEKAPLESADTGTVDWCEFLEPVPGVRHTPDMNESVIGGKMRRSNGNPLDTSTESVDDTIVEKPLEKRSKRCLEDTLLVSPSVMSRVDRKPAKDRQVKRRAARAFFQSQAVVSDGADDSEDEDDGPEGEASLASFVICSDDDEQPSAVDMRAVYLQSVRSPVVRRGAFKMPSSDYRGAERGGQQAATREVYLDSEDDFCNAMDDCSQLPCSFIDDGNTMPTQADELCELERAEQILKQRRREKRRARQQPAEQQKRRRIVQIDSSDSD